MATITTRDGTTIFYKDVKDFTYTRVYNFNLLDSNGIPIPDSAGDFEYERPTNGSSCFSSDAHSRLVEICRRNERRSCSAGEADSCLKRRNGGSSRRKERTNE